MGTKPPLALAFLATLLVAGACQSVVGCSSSDPAPAPSSASSSSSSSSSASSSSSSSSSSGAAASDGGYGATCTNPLNGGGGGGGEGGAGGGGTDGGGLDPACTGTYSLCATVGGAVKCTKSCAYPGGGGGPKASPDCPNPPTNGMCTPRGFCQ